MSAPATAPAGTTPVDIEAARAKADALLQRMQDLLQDVECASREVCALDGFAELGGDDGHGLVDTLESIERHVKQVSNRAWHVQCQVRHPEPVMHECEWCEDEFGRNEVFTVSDSGVQRKICEPCAEDHRYIADDSNRLGDGS